MEITRSTQDRNKIVTADGYAYVKKKNLANGWESFECERRRNYDGCKGKINVKDNLMVPTMDHHHAPDPARNEVIKI